METLFEDVQYHFYSIYKKPNCSNCSIPPLKQENFITSVSQDLSFRLLFLTLESLLAGSSSLVASM